VLRFHDFGMQWARGVLAKAFAMTVMDARSRLSVSNVNATTKISALPFVAETFPAFPGVRQGSRLCSFASVDVECGAPQGGSFDCGGSITLIRRGPDLESGVQIEGGAAAAKLMPSHLASKLIAIIAQTIGTALCVGLACYRSMFAISWIVRGFVRD